MAESKYGKKNETLASVYLEIAKVNMLKGNMDEAISNQKHAYDIFSQLDSVDPNQVASIMITLSEWHEKANKLSDAIECMVRAIAILDQNKETNAKERCKAERNLSILYKKNKEFQKAIDQLFKIEVLH